MSFIARIGSRGGDGSGIRRRGDARRKGHLLRTSDGTTAKLNAYLEDHAFLIEGLLDLYEATFEPHGSAQALGAR